MALSVDNLWVFSASHDDVLKLYSMEEMRITRSIQIPNMTSLSCLFPLPDNKTILLGSKNNSVATYSIECGRTSDYLAVHR